MFQFLRILACAIALAAAWPACGPALAADEDDFSAPFDADLGEKVRQANQECYGCHTRAGVTKPPRADLDLAKLVGLTIDPARYDQSSHTGMDCKDCHQGGYAEFPHGKDRRQQAKACRECHKLATPRIEAEFKDSVHAKQHASKFTCESCHDTHVYRTAEKIRAPKLVVKQDNEMCTGCHESDLRYARFVADVRLRKLDDLHDWLPNPKRHWQAVRCVECHTPLSAEGLSHEVLTKKKSERNCTACHSADSSLRTRLYRHLAREERANAAGFLNAYLLTDAYVVGATRNRWLDWASWGAAAALFGGLGLHLALRLYFARRRKS